MPRERRDLISDLYHRALARAPEERGAFLTEACNGDDGLRQEVESLLAFESASAQFLERRTIGVAAPVDDVPSMIDRQLGPYTIVAPLGAGAMGEVYRARDRKLGRDVAIKILPSHFTADPERRARFAREARLLATLNHPHIGAIYGLEESDGVSALVLELVEGQTLADRLEGGPLPIAEALAVARQIAEALEAAHENRIVHRDLKPANIILQGAADRLSADVRVKVLDFGLAKPMALDVAAGPTQGPSGSFDGTVDGRILGTPAYMSPEQARGLAIDERTDIWAFGCVLFEMLTGRRAFDGATITDTLARILDHEPNWTALPQQTPAGIRALLERCLRKDPRKRLRAIADALIEIEDHASPLAGARAALVETPAVPSRHRERVAWIVAGASAIALSGLALLYVRDPRPTPSEPVEFAIALPEDSRFTGNAPEFAISPDGRHVAFTVSSDGISRVWVRSLATLELRTLPGTEGARSPFWKPDSRALGFFATQQLKTIQLNGGSPIVVCNAPWPAGSSYIGGTWNEAGVIVFGRGSGPLHQVTAVQAGGVASPLTKLVEGDVVHRWPSFLPDGQHFLYLAQRGMTDELRIGSLSSADTISFGPFESHATYAAGYLFFVRGGNLMAQPFDANTRHLGGEPLLVAAQTAIDAPFQRGMFSVSAAALVYSRAARTPWELTWRDRQGNVVGTAGRPGVYFNLDLSPDEQRVTISQMTQAPGARARFDIWLIDLTRDGAASPLTDDPAWEFDPAWSPDGRQIAFNSNRPLPQRSAYSLFVRASNSSGQDFKLVDGGGTTVNMPDWSRDGFIVYTHDQDLWTLPMTGDGKPTVFLKTEHQEMDGVFSPDGRWIAYHSNASGRHEVYVRPFPPGEGFIPISSAGGWSPRWRADGSELFFLSLEGAMMAVTIDRTNGLTAGVPQRLFQTQIRFGSGQNRFYDVTGNAQRFLVPRMGPGTPIIVESNWQAKLGK